ncbi:MAG: Ig-like domain-containing protein [Proteiniphilum sp.]
MKRIMFSLMVALMVLTTACNNDDDGLEKIIPVTGITLDQTELIVAPGLNKVLKANITPRDATNKSVKWSSDHPAVEIDEATGEMRVLSVTENKVNITATTVDGGFTASVSLRVVDIPAIGVSLKESDIVVGLGKTKTVEAIVKPNAAANKNVTWESDNPAIASINQTTGEITAHATGVAKITVITVDGGFKASAYVRVPSLTNLLKNPGFEEDYENATPPNWIKLTQDWFKSYYEDPGSVTVDQTQTNRIAASDVLFTGNGAFFKPYITGDYVGRIQVNKTGGVYQIISVAPGKEYWISMDIGYRNGNKNSSIPTNDKVKILSSDGKTTYYEVPIVPPGATTGNGTTAVILGVSGYFTVPAGITQVRFQFDLRSYPNPNQSPLTLFDNCEFRELPGRP